MGMQYSDLPGQGHKSPSGVMSRMNIFQTHKNWRSEGLILRKVEELFPEKGIEWVGGVVGIE